jgi:uncharacterized protein YsxB (DUF464 family)
VIEVYLTNLYKEDIILKAGSGKYILLKATGHAGFGKKHTDVVCAGVSAIIQTAVVAITKVAKINQKIKQKDGFLETTIKISKLEPAALNNLLIIMNSMLAGLEEIIKIHPETVKIYFEKRG